MDLTNAFCVKKIGNYTYIEVDVMQFNSVHENDLKWQKQNTDFDGTQLKEKKKKIPLNAI